MSHVTGIHLCPPSAVPAAEGKLISSSLSSLC